jgi:hypothetical protein
MYPNQQQPPTSAADYLNQISPQAPKKRFLGRKELIVASVLAALVLLVVILAVALNAGGGTNTPKQLAARLISTQTIVDDAQSKLKSTELRTLNSNLSIYLTNTNRDIIEPLAAVKVDIKKIDKSITTAEAGTDITARLEDARLNATYDRTYAREIAYQLEKIGALMRQLYTSTKSVKFKTFLDGAYTNLAPTQKAFETFNATNG